MAYFVNTKESVVLITDVEEDEALEIRGGKTIDVDSVTGLSQSRQWKKFVDLGIMKEISEDQKVQIESSTEEEDNTEEESSSDHKDAIMIDLTEELNELHGHEGEATNATVAEAEEGMSRPSDIEMEKIADGSPDHSHSPRPNQKSPDVTPTSATYAEIDDDQVGGETKAQKSELTRPAEETEQIFVELEEVKDNSH